MHSTELLGPLPHGEDRFAVVFKMDVTMKPMNNARIMMQEVGIYTVKDDKVIREEFYYASGD